LLAGLNAWVFHSGIWLKVSNGPGRVPPFRARLAGIVSLLVWTCVVVRGAMIAYNWFDKSRK